MLQLNATFATCSVNPHYNSSNQSGYQAEVYFKKLFQIIILVKLLGVPDNTASHGELIPKMTQCYEYSFSFSVLYWNNIPNIEKVFFLENTKSEN